MSRQRYLENSGLDAGCSHAVSVASQPMGPRSCSSAELHTFIQEQRKIISSFRTQPWPMQMKLTALRCYKRNISKYVSHLNTIDTFRDSSVQVFRKFKRRWRAACQYLTIWGTIIKKIEGNFGSSVASFFTFLRWLCALNLSLTLLVLGFLILPQVLAGHGLEVPPSVRENGSAVSFLFDGKGYVFEFSVMFYGYYDSGRGEPYTPPPANPDPRIGPFYKLPLTYLLVVLSLFVLSVVALLFSMAEKYKLLQRANASEQFPFSWKVFASWDYAITGRDTVAGKMKHFAVSLKETIDEARKKQDSELHIKLWIVRVLTNILVFVCLASTSYAIFLAVENADNTNAATHQRSFQTVLSRGWHGIWLFILSFQVQMVIVARNFLLPYVFTIAQYAEKFHPRTALKMMLVRMFLLYLSSLYVMVIALFTISKQCKGDSGESEDGGSGRGGEQEFCCWETVVGQELYKLTLTQLLADVSSIVLVDALRWALGKLTCSERLQKLIGPAEFKLADNILKLVYGQALILLGVLFCPLLPAIGFSKNVLLFYCRALAVYFFNKPPRTLFRVASTRNFYMLLLLLTTFLCALPVGYAVVQITPSISCGPFRGLPSMVDIIFNEIRNWPRFLQSVMDYMQTATVIVPLLAVLSIVIYYYAALSHALKEVNKDLQLQLRTELNEARERIAQEAHPRTVAHRHRELQRAIHEELQRSGVGVEPGGETEDLPSPYSEQEFHLPEGWGQYPHAAGHPQRRAVPVEPPRAPLSNTTTTRQDHFW